MRQFLSTGLEQQSHQSRFSVDSQGNISQFADNRPETAAQRQLINRMQANSQTSVQRQLAESMSVGLRMAALREQRNRFIQRKSEKQQWEMPGDIKTHIFDGEEKGNNLSGLHSSARKNPANEKLRYSEETAGFVNNSKPYGAKVKAKFGKKDWSPKNLVYKYSDMFPASWNESTVTEAIEAAYDSTFTYKPNGETIKHRDAWKDGIWLGNAKGIAIVFAGHPPETIYPHR